MANLGPVQPIPPEALVMGWKPETTIDHQTIKNRGKAKLNG